MPTILIFSIEAGRDFSYLANSLLSFGSPRQQTSSRGKRQFRNKSFRVMTTPIYSPILQPCLPPHTSTTRTMTQRRPPQTRPKQPNSQRASGTFAEPIVLRSSQSTTPSPPLTAIPLPDGPSQASNPFTPPAPLPKPDNLIPVPTPLPYTILIGLRAPIFINRAADPTTLIPELLRLAARRPQPLDLSYAGAHIPSNPIVFLCIRDFYGCGRSVVGFFNPTVEENACEGWREWGNGAAEMFFTECSDADLAASEVMVAQIGENWGRWGDGEAERVEAGQEERAGGRWEYRRLQRVVEMFWHARVDEALITRRPWMFGDD
ncbi:uncharacterized protein BDZ99DRAFT_570369 [Mytilinidion resinicola]|uniref:Uncharacterized protein n=1 Tax=Mytilinidion resinicola TaxID=574789 RepID=A0A6A6YQC4_9PEZI|nr:uncharacterized protein BDZ99DRAFT_570369 [Mytilinidion resinicola]KAF2811106.1 hypothetical protein BDZ99DRAFT_570369 [Mytilinidion resinicola]